MEKLKVTKEEAASTGLELVSYAGEARSLLLEALSDARESNFTDAESKIAEAKLLINKAHNAQTNIMQMEAKGAEVEYSFIMIHGQDHLMTTILLRDIIEDLIHFYKKR